MRFRNILLLTYQQWSKQGIKQYGILSSLNLKNLNNLNITLFPKLMFLHFQYKLFFSDCIKSYLALKENAT